MGFICVTYNIQYGIGMDGRYDPERIAEAVRGADVIALQEVTRNHPQNGGRDMVAELADLLPDYFHLFGAPFQVHIGSHLDNGRAVNRFFEFGNMVLSKTPILAARNLLLPRSQRTSELNLQRSALETVIATPVGPVRFHSVHLDHVSPAERLAQIDVLMRLAVEHHLDGGAVSGVTKLGYPEPPLANHFMLMGDFNLVPESAEYVALTGPDDAEYGRPLNARLVSDVSIPDGVAAADSLTWFDPDGVEPAKRLDYCFASASLAPHCRNASVDTRAQGSDHRPVRVEIA
ncbi:MAG: endonuclease/exonuclease/phosphatase family protein [Notoacmeibacter sp.]|nr:endonuclease/exonuclease/phosphatase family protein [Notoacmeibacter sp.]